VREGDDTATIVGRHNRDAVDVFPLGERLSAEENTTIGQVLRTGLVSLAVASAHARADLRASRARVMKARDEQRRKLERNLPTARRVRSAPAGRELSCASTLGLTAKSTGSSTSAPTTRRAARPIMAA